MAQKKPGYGNQSISALKGADRVRKRPGVIFGSDGLEGCEHAVFEILSNAIDEAREGHGDLITVTRFEDGSIQVEDAGRGCPVDWNEKEQRYNWELVYCELYAGGKYGDNSDNYEYSLGLNGLGACATQYASEYFDAPSTGTAPNTPSTLKRGNILAGSTKNPLTGAGRRAPPSAGSPTWTSLPTSPSPRSTSRRDEAPGCGQLRVTFRFRNQWGGSSRPPTSSTTTALRTMSMNWPGGKSLDPACVLADRAEGPGPGGQAGVQGEAVGLLLLLQPGAIVEHYHNSSWLEHGGSPEKAVKSAFVSAIDGHLKTAGQVPEKRGARSPSTTSRTAWCW